MSGGGQERSHEPKLRLALRLALALCAGAAAILVVAGTLNLLMQRSHLLEIVNTSADRIVETIRTSTRDAMVRNRADEVHRIIETIGAQAGIDRIRVFDKQGKIQTSTEPTEIGLLVDTNAEACHGCHQRDRPLDRLDRDDRMRIFTVDDGARVMGVISPIRNEPDCAGVGCHASPDAQRVLGVLDVRLSLEAVDDDLAASEVEMFVGLAATALAVLGLALVLSWNMVLRPVRRLTDAASRVAAGDLSATVREGSSDEIGELSSAWNAMVGEVRRSRDQLEASSQMLEEKVREKTAELENAHERMMLAEKMASLGKLAAVVAHEINNPLAGISTYAKLLSKRLGEGAPAADGEGTGSTMETQRVLGLIETEALRCGDIVRNLLLFSRAHGANFAPHELTPLVERCIMLVRHQAELAEVELRLDADAGLPAILCDASQVQQMILALVMNAVEASTCGDTVSIALFHDTATGTVGLRVEDQGHGITPEDLPHIFEPFFTTKDEEGAGLGLGLAVVYGIVNRHDGRCDVESTPDSGTVFTIRLPADKPDAAGNADSTQ